MASNARNRIIITGNCFDEANELSLEYLNALLRGYMGTPIHTTAAILLPAGPDAQALPVSSGGEQLQEISAAQRAAHMAESTVQLPHPPSPTLAAAGRAEGVEGPKGSEGLPAVPAGDATAATSEGRKLTARELDLLLPFMRHLLLCNAWYGNPFFFASTLSSSNFDCITSTNLFCAFCYSSCHPSAFDRLLVISFRINSTRTADQWADNFVSY